MRCLLLAVLVVLLPACDSQPPPAESAQSTEAPSDPAAAINAADPSDAQIDQTIDEVLGDHAAYRRLFDDLQRAVAHDDRAGFATLVSYPIEVTIDGQTRTIADAEAFVSRYDEILTNEIRSTIQSQRYADVMVNWQGVMLGDGQVWLNGVCVDSPCSESRPLVTTLQNASSPPQVTEPASGPTQTPNVRIELGISEGVQALLNAGESLIISADYFGSPTPGAELPPELQGQPWLSVARLQVQREAAGQVVLPPTDVDQDVLAYTDVGSLGLNINVFSGRRTDPDNLIDCGFFQDTWQVAITKPIAIECERLQGPEAAR